MDAGSIVDDARDISRRVWIVAPHFPPLNLASVHRARLLANHLGACAWEARVLAVHPAYYEERLDPDLERLVDPSIQISRVCAEGLRVRYEGCPSQALVEHFTKPRRRGESGRWKSCGAFDPPGIAPTHKRGW